MNSDLIKLPIWFIALVFVQVLILNNIQLSGYINPFLYIIFILWMPFEMNKALVMLIAFVMGLAVDIFSNTPGMHASVFLAFCRPYVLRLLAPRDGYEVTHSPGIQHMGFQWFFVYAALLTLLHHLFLFYVEVFRFEDFFRTLGRALLSTLLTLLLILLTQLFRYNANERS